MSRQRRAATSRVVLITGASRGIGRACATVLSEHGHRVFGTGRASEPELSANAPSGVEMLSLDVDDDASVARVVATVLSRAGRLDVAVNNAGVGINGAVEDTSTAELHAQFNTNVFGAWRVSRAVLPVMRAQGSGLIVNIGSLAGLTGVPFQAAYSASKFALEGLTESLRLEVAAFGVHAVVLEPGNVDTAVTARSARTAQRTPAYEALLGRAVDAMIEQEAAGVPPAAVARTLAKVITTPNPRPRYTVGARSERAAVFARRLLPASWFEQVLRRTYFRGAAVAAQSEPDQEPDQPRDGGRT
jgi:NAD(P)-dependent dehydrogenase (short-subunit alcohol dehydrogenase family)